MDVLYVLGDGSTHNNEELRYSLRSLARYGKGLKRVYIVGECPDWINKEVVTYIPCDNPYDHKAHNIWHKVLHAIDNSDLPNEFLLSSDDIFHVKYQDLNNYPYYHKNNATVGQSDAVAGTGLYAILQQTVRLLNKYKYPLEDYGGGHCLHHVNVDIIRHMPKIIADSFASTYGGCFDVLMGNAIVKLKKPKTTPRKDIKIRNVKDENDLILQLGHSEAFSIYDSAWDDYIGTWLMKKFPRKCRFEI